MERWGRFGDRVVDFFPDEGIVIAGNDRLEEGFNAVEVEVVGVDGGVESQQIAKEILTTAARTEQTRGA